MEVNCRDNEGVQPNPDTRNADGGGVVDQPQQNETQTLGRSLEVMASGPSQPVGGAVVSKSEAGGLDEGPSPAPTHVEILSSINAKLDRIESSISDLRQATESLARLQEIMQKGMRQIDLRIADVATSLTAPRIRELYLRLLLLYDLLEPTPAHLGQESAALCKLVAGQIEQFLEVNGFSRIETDGRVFDPRLHRPINVVPVDDPTQDSRILSTVCNGFQSATTVLRPASVIIGSLGHDPKTENHRPQGERSGIDSSEKPGGVSGETREANCDTSSLTTDRSK